MYPAAALLALLFTTVIWGIGPVFIRTLSVDLGPADHLSIRYAIVAVLYLVGLAFTGGWRIARRDWPRLLIISVIGMVGYNLGSAFGFAHVSAGIGSLIIGTQPLLIALLSAAIAREPLSYSMVTGLVLAFVGTGLLVWNDLVNVGNSSALLLGAALVFGSGVAWAIYVVLAKPLIRTYGSYSITAISISIASAIMLAALARPSTLVTVQTMTPRNWLDMGFMVVLSTFIATITWNYGASRIPSAAAGAFIYLVPIIGVFAGAAMLNETITPSMLAGGALIIVGVAIAQFGPKLLRVPTLKASGLALAAVIFAVTMWGLVPVAMRFLILDLEPQTAMLLRLYPAGLIAVIVLLFVGVRRIDRGDWGRIIIAAVGGHVGYQVLAAFGIKTVPASWTGMLFGLEPVFIAIFAVLFAKDRLTAWLIGGIALALCGTAVLMLGSTLVPASDVGLFGIVLVTLSTMGWGIYTVVIRPVANKYGAFQVACLALGISALPMLFFATPDLPHIIEGMTLTHWLVVAFLAVFATLLSTSAWNYALGHMESSLAGMFLYVQPIVATIGGILLLDEKLSWPLVAGGTLIIAGVALAQFGPSLRKARYSKVDLQSSPFMGEDGRGTRQERVEPTLVRDTPRLALTRLSAPMKEAD
jgi:drug/metabolite transporter (DMT)-like permease